MIDFIQNNKEWLFSGIGVAILTGLISLLLKRKREISHIINKNVIGNNNQIQFNNFIEKKDADLKLVDIIIEHETGYPVLDIKVRNSGDEVIFIKEIIFNIIDHYAMKNPQTTDYQFIESSNTYDIVLDDKQKQVYKLSQEISPNSTDRFKIKMGSSISEVKMVTFYYFNATIVYNEENKSIKSELFIIPVPSIIEWAGCYVSNFSPQLARLNYMELLKFNRYEAIKDPIFLEILESYDKNKNDFL